MEAKAVGTVVVLKVMLPKQLLRMKLRQLLQRLKRGVTRI